MNGKQIYLTYLMVSFVLIFGIVFIFKFVNSGDIGKEQLNSTTIIGDKEKVYDADTKTVILNDETTKEDIISIKLNTPLNNQVPIGEDILVFEKTFYPEMDISSIIKQITYTNLKNGQPISKNVIVRYKTLKNVIVNDYSLDCSETFKNGTKICKDTLIGNHIEQKISWENWGGTLNSKENITLGFFTDVAIGDKIEWIPTYSIPSLDGKTITDISIPEWATWEGNLSVSILSYWKLDDNDLRDWVVGANNGTLQTSTNTSGKIQYAQNFTTNQNFSVGNNTIDITTSNMTLNAWVYSDYIGADKRVICTDTTQGYCVYIGSDGTIKFGSPGVNEISATQKMKNSTWTMVSIVYDQSANFVSFYVNGTFSDTDAYSYNFQDGDKYWIGGGYNAPTYNWQGKIDEVSVYTRALSSTEISYHYNSGDGCQYGNETCYGIPPSTNCNFTGYVKDSVGGALSGANVIIVNQTDNKAYYNTTSNAQGLWTINVTNSNQLFTALAYFNSSLVGIAKPYINSTCV